MATVPPPPHRDRTFALACMTLTACVAIVAIYALATRPPQGGTAPAVQYLPAPPANGAAPATPEGTAVNVAGLKGSDGQPLIVLEDATAAAPPRPANPDALPEEDSSHWYDMEYAGWNTRKINPITPPPANASGAKGKRVVCLRSIDHPYFTAYSRGMQQVADAYGIQLKTLVANGDINLQSQQVDQVINEKADLVIITPVDAKAMKPLFKRLNDARVPVIASNLIPSDDAMPYVMAWTGPDDWGQMRVLAREFAKRMNYEGGYTIVRHVPGGSPYFSRTFGVITELKKIAPKMECLAMEPTGLKAEETMQTVSGWITRFGPKMKGIVSADDSGAQTGITEACKNAKREAIVRVAAGNSKVGMDFVKTGELAAITSQSAEGDGALPMKLAGDFFCGKAAEKPVYYLRKTLITKDNVEQFMPPQW